MTKTILLVIVAAVALVCFAILPWYVFAETDGAGTFSLLGDSGVDAGKYTLLLIPLSSIIIFVLAFLRRADEAKPWLIYLILGAVNFIPLIWWFLWMRDVPLTLGLGVWVTLATTIILVVIAGIGFYQERGAAV